MRLINNCFLSLLKRRFPHYDLADFESGKVRTLKSVGTILLGIAFLWFGMAEPAWAERRVALVIGNGSYAHAPTLKSPLNDAEDVAAALKALRFDVMQGTDLNGADVRKLAKKFAKKSRGAAVVLFYYSGHSVQFHRKNYLMPVDAALKDESKIESDLVPVKVVLAGMDSKAKTRLVFLDTGWRNPLAANLAKRLKGRKDAIGPGLAREDTGIGGFIAFAAQPQAVVPDTKGRNSAFTAALLKEIGSSGLDIAALMRRVRAAVVAATDGKQVPWDQSSLIRRFAFEGDPAEPADKTRNKVAGKKLNPCDALAAHPQDPDAVAPGIGIGKISPKKAIRACRAAVKKEPDTRRFIFQLARALLAAGEFAEAKSWLEKAAAKEHGPSMHRIASLYQNGLVFAGGTRLPHDAGAALDWYKRASETGYGPSMTNIGWLYMEGRGVKKDEKEAANWFLKAAEAGNVPGMKAIAQMYLKGVGVPKDEAKASKWLVRAGKKPSPVGTAGKEADLNLVTSALPEEKADENSPRYKQLVKTCNALAPHASDWLRTKSGQPIARVDARVTGKACYQAGQIRRTADITFQVGRALRLLGKPAKIDKLWETAANDNHIQAMHGLGLLHQEGKLVKQDHAKALEWFKKSADAGYAPSMTEIGIHHSRGFGVPRNDEESVHWYRKGAKAGDPIGMYNLANRYAAGRGIEQDLAQAAHWYLKSAEAGDIDAMNNIAVYYDNGRGVPKNEAEALKWYGKAVKGGSIAANYNLGLMYWNGNGTSKDRDKAGPLFVKAADNGHGRNALYFAGRAFLYGHGVEKNAKTAITYLTRSDKAGHPNAAFFLGVIYDKGMGVEKNHDKAFKWFKKAADAGDGEAAFSVGYYYDKGLSVRLSYKNAAKYLYRAISKGDDRALKMLSEKPKQWKRQTRKALQDLMRKSGHYKGRVDGKYGRGTIEALNRLAGKGNG